MANLGNNELRQYGLLALPLAVAGLPLYLHVPDFYVTEHGLSLSLIGIVLLLVRFIDAFQDPLIGALSDRYSAIRRPLMLAGSAGLGVGMLALLVPPGEVGMVWFAVWVVVSTSCYSLVTINLNTIGGIWSNNIHERTRIASTRERFGLIGVSLGVMIPGVLTALYGKVSAFSIFALGLVVVLVYSGWRFNRWAGDHTSLVNGEPNRERLLRNLSIPRDRGVRRLVGVTFIGALASALPAVLFLFFVRDRLERESLAWLFLLIYFIAAMSGVALWRDLSRRIGKVSAWCLSIAFASLAFIGAVFTGPGDLVLYGGVCLLTGFALGGDLVFPASLMADQVGESRSGRSHASSGYAWLSFVQKAGLGLAAGIAFPVLGWMGFSSGESNAPMALASLTALYAAFPLVLKLCSAALLWLWRDHFESQETHEEETNNNWNRAAAAGLDSHRMHKPYEN